MAIQNLHKQLGINKHVKIGRFNSNIIIIVM